MAPAKGTTKTPDQDTEETTDEAATGGESAEAAEKRTRRAGPSYGLKKVSKIPDNAPIRRKPSNRNRYRDLLTPIVEDAELHGEWLEIAEFNTPTGAKDVAKAIKKGEKTVPGDGEWEFQYRRLEREATEADVERGAEVGSMVKFSVLYACYTPG